MSKMHKTPAYKLQASAILLIFLWIYAATAKLLEFDQFSVQMSQVAFLKPVAGILVWIIPLIEYSLAALLLVSKTRRLGLMGSAILMSVFTLYIAGMVSFSTELPCSCGGILSDFTWQHHLVFNLFFTILSIWGGYQYILLQKPNNNNNSNSRARDDAGDAKNL